MKNIFPILLVFLMVFSFACHHPLQNENIPPSRHLIADTVCEYPYYFQGSVMMKNSYIFMIDQFNAGGIRFYNTQTGKMDTIQAGIIIDKKTGQPMYFSMNDSTKYPDTFIQQLPLSFYQSDMRSYFTYSFENNKVKLNRQNFRLKGKRINRVEQLNENKYVTLGFFRDGLLGLYDKESKLMDYYGKYPVSVAVPRERDAMESIVISFQGNIAYSDIHSKVVYASSSFAYLSCYRFTGKKLKLQWEKHIVPPPETKIVDDFLEIDKTVTHGGFSDVAVAGDYIFATYTQKNITDSIPDTTHSILVYDMTGNHVAIYHIDSSISNIVVDINEGALYGFSRDVEWEPVMVRFQFDKI